jgi:hypothetical protein
LFIVGWCFLCFVFSDCPVDCWFGLVFRFFVGLGGFYVDFFSYDRPVDCCFRLVVGLLLVVGTFCFVFGPVVRLIVGSVLSSFFLLVWVVFPFGTTG